MNTLLRRFASLAVMFFLVSCGHRFDEGRTAAAGPQHTPTHTPLPVDGGFIHKAGDTPPGIKISPEQAFRKGILSLNGKVDLYDTNGVIRFHRSPRGFWFMQLSKYPGQPLGGIWVTIQDDGTVETGYGF